MEKTQQSELVGLVGQLTCAPSGMKAFQQNVSHWNSSLRSTSSFKIKEREILVKEILEIMSSKIVLKF